jgi:hypothetical protein
MVAAVLNAHSGRRMTSRAGFRSIDTCAQPQPNPNERQRRQILRTHARSLARSHAHLLART